MATKKTKAAKKPLGKKVMKKARGGTNPSMALLDDQVVAGGQKPRQPGAGRFVPSDPYGGGMA